MRIGTLEIPTLWILMTLFGAVPCRADELTFDLHSPSVPKGSTVREFSHFLLGPAEASFTVAGREAHATMTLVGSTLDAETVARGAKGELTDSHRRVMLNAMSDSFESGGEPEVEVKHNALEGSTVHFVKKGDVWSRELIEHAPSPDEKKALDELHAPSDDELAYPIERIPIGYAWTVSGDSLKALMGGGELRPVSGTAQLTFVRVSELEGDSCAVVDVSLHVAFRMDMGDGNDLGVAFVGWGKIFRSLRTGLERQSWIKGEAVLGGQLPTENGTMDAMIRGQLMMTSTNRLDGNVE